VAAVVVLLHPLEECGKECIMVWWGKLVKSWGSKEFEKKSRIEVAIVPLRSPKVAAFAVPIKGVGGDVIPH